MTVYVKSSFIELVEVHEVAEGTSEVYFFMTSGNVYGYTVTDMTLVNKIINKEFDSIGKFYNANIKGKFDSFKVD